jgi:hypothetical protein
MTANIPAGSSANPAPGAAGREAIENEAVAGLSEAH